MEIKLLYFKYGYAIMAVLWGGEIAWVYHMTRVILPTSISRLNEYCISHLEEDVIPYLCDKCPAFTALGSVK